MPLQISPLHFCQQGFVFMVSFAHEIKTQGLYCVTAVSSEWR